MGQVTFAPSDKIYLDTAPVIYSVEKHRDYWILMQPVWAALQNGEIQIITSELTLLEVLVAPIKQNDSSLAADYENLLTRTEINSSAVTAEVLRRAAELRARHNFKTPDAIHAATAQINNCDLLIANDSAFERVSGLRVVILKDLI